MELSDIELFTGRTDVINRFRDFLTQIKTGSEERRGGIISGKKGMGKTFTLRKFEELASIERFKVIYQKLTPGNVEHFFAGIKDRITEFAPKKKSRFSLRSEEDLSMPSLPKGTTRTPELIEDYVDEFFQGLEDIQERLTSQKMWALFLVDDTEFFAIRDFENAYYIILDILRRLREDGFPIVIIFTISDEFMKYLPSDDLETQLELFSLGKISSKEAEIFLKRVETKYDITIDVKEKLIRAGRGNPYVLASATNYLYENRDNSSINENVWSNCKNAILNEDIVTIFNLSDEELKILENIASRKENLATLLELEAISDSKANLNNVLQNLQEKKLLVIEKTFAYFSSKYLFQTLKRTSERLNIFGRANILLDLFKESISAGKRPDAQLKKKLDELKNIAVAQQGTVILTEIAEAYSAMGETLMGQEMFYEAFSLFSSAIELFEQIEDLERAALLCDEMAKRFSKSKKPYYARKFLAEGARLYDKIGSEWKRNALSRSAAMLYEEAGDLYAAESFDAFTRLFYRRAYSLYRAANEGVRAKKVCQKAREGISNEFYRKEFDKLAQKIVIEPKRES